MPHRVFDLPEMTGEEVTFEMGGTLFHTRRPTFMLGVLLRRATEDSTPLEERLVAIERVVRSMVLPEESEALLDVLPMTEMQPIVELFRYVQESWTGRPTVPSSVSSRSPAPVGNASTPVVSSPVSTSVA